MSQGARVIIKTVPGGLMSTFCKDALNLYNCVVRNTSTVLDGSL